MDHTAYCSLRGAIFIVNFNVALEFFVNTSRQPGLQSLSPNDEPFYPMGQGSAFGQNGEMRRSQFDHIRFVIGDNLFNSLSFTINNDSATGDERNKYGRYGQIK